MGQNRFYAACLRAAWALSVGVLLASCSTTTSVRVESAAVAAASGDDGHEEAGDGRPQANRAGGVLSAPRPGVAARTPISPEIPTGTVFPSALPNVQTERDQMVAHFINVGQGDAILLEFSCAAVLIDTGGEMTAEVNGQQRLARYLRKFFQRRTDLANTLKLVVLSHPHVDHTGGVETLLDLQPRINVENVVDNGATSGGHKGIAGQLLLQQYATDAGANYVGVAESAIKTAAGMSSAIVDPVNCSANGGVDPKIVALWGRVDLDNTWANNPNNDSVVLRVDFENASFLFTGDLQSDGINAMLASYEADRSIFNVDVLKVGHHGSHNATTPSLIAATTPKVAIIQAGDSALSQDQYSAYSFGHPNKKAIDMLLDPVNGVSMSRPAKTVRVGLKGRAPNSDAPPEFTTMSVKKAIYTTAWDGNIAVVANRDGTLRVETGF